MTIAKEKNNPRAFNIFEQNTFAITDTAVRLSRRNDFVRLSFHGLAISCFSEQTEQKPGRNETAVLREGRHQLKIDIIEYFEGEETNRISIGSLPKKNVEISIKGENNPAISGYKLYMPKADFTRTPGNENDEFDLRWMIDLEGSEFHKNSLPLALGNQIPLTKLFIQNAEFFTINRSIYSQKRKSANGDFVDFGKVGCEMGALIEDDVVSLEIKRKNDILHSVSLVKKPYTRYEIRIENLTPPPGDLVSDFFQYYQIFDVAESERFDMLNPFGEVGVNCEQTGQVDRKVFCGMAFAGMTTDINDYFI